MCMLHTPPRTIRPYGFTGRYTSPIRPNPAPITSSKRRCDGRKSRERFVRTEHIAEKNMVMEHNFNYTSHESHDMQSQASRGQAHSTPCYEPGASEATEPTDTAFCGLQFRPPGGSSPPAACADAEPGSRENRVTSVRASEVTAHAGVTPHVHDSHPHRHMSPYPAAQPA